MENGLRHLPPVLILVALAARAAAQPVATATSPPLPPPAAAAESAAAQAFSQRLAAAQAAWKEGKAADKAGESAAAVEASRRGLAILGDLTGHEADSVRAALHYNLGRALYLTGKTGESAASYRIAAALAKELGDRPMEADGLLGLAVSQFVLGIYDDALENSLAALRIAEADNLAEVESHARHMAGMVHRNMGQNQEALTFFQRATELALAANASLSAVRCMNEEGNALHNLGRDEAAKARKREALALARKIGDEDGASDCLNDLGEILAAQGEYAQALPYFEESYEITGRLGDPRERVIAATNLATALASGGDPGRARSLLEQALELTRTNDLPAEEESVRSALASLLADSGEPAGAYTELLRAYQLRKTTLTDEAAQRTADLRALYDAERREAEIELLKRDRAIQALTLERHKARQRWWTAGFVVAALFAVVLGTGWRMKTRSARALAAANRKVEQLARTDPLTGLANRRHTLERLHQESLRAQRGQAQFSLVLADIDHFKRINDTYGHECGDRVLVQVAEALAATVRSLDVVARWGGEEFLLVLPGTDRDGAVTVAEHAREALAGGRIAVPDRPIRVTATFGVAVCVDGDVDACLRAADAALYRGKKAGRNTVVAA
jgi:diguanylate cyclase (GGDEF)-like protein